MNKTGIYCRLSKDDAEVGESKSITNQREMLIDYAEQHELNIVDIYIDDGISGMEFSRPDFQRMLHDAETGKIDTILVKDISRFSRDDVIVKQYLHERFYIWGIRFIAIDGTDNISKDFLDTTAFRAFFNEYYVRDCSRKVKAVFDAKKARGEFYKCAPYGYKKDPLDNNHLIPDDNVVPIVQRIFTEFTNGISLKQIAINLNNDEIPNPAVYKKTIYPNYRSKYTITKWTDSSIRTILHNEVYIGTTVLGKSEKKSYRQKDKTAIPREDWVRTPNTHEPIISMELWNKVNERTGKKVKANRQTKRLLPLAGKVFCHKCGRPMTRHTYTNPKYKYIYYRCTNSINGSKLCDNNKGVKVDLVDQIILDEINTAIKTYIDSDKIQVKAANTDKYTKQITKLNNTITTTQNRLDKLYEDLTDGIITKDQYKRLQDKYNTQIQDTEQQLQQVQQQLDSLNDTQHIDDIVHKYSTGNITELSNELAEDLVDNVTIGRLHNGAVVTVNLKI